MRLPSKFMLLSISFLLACSKKNASTQFERQGNFQKVSLATREQQVKIPTELWDMIEKFYADSLMTIEEKIADAKSKKKPEKIDASIVFMPVDVFLTEENYGSLGGQNYHFDFEQGGGTLDLSSYVKPDKRGFLLAIELGEKWDKGIFKVFFVSNGKETKIGNSTYGSGCGKYMDITSYFTNVISRKGIELSSNNRRYVHVAAGTYIFAISKNSSLHLAQVTITDSRFKKSMCRV